MPRSNAWSKKILQYVFHGVIPTLGTDLYLSLHDGVLTADDTQDVNEVSYPGYARQPVPRNDTYWNVPTPAGSADSLAGLKIRIDFPAVSGGGIVIDYVGIGTSVSGPTELIYFGNTTPTPTTVLDGFIPYINTDNGTGGFHSTKVIEQ